MNLILRLIRESIIMAWHALVVNKLRTFLSLLGVTIGIFAIITVFTAVDSMEDNVKGSVEKLGNNVIYVQKWPWAFGSEYPWWKYWQRPLPTISEMTQLKERSQLAEEMAFMAVLSTQTLKWEGNTVENVDINLASHDYNRIAGFDLYEGRYFTEAESNGGYPVALVGYEIAKNLFPYSSALDKSITVKGRKARVVGVFAKEGESLIGNSNDNTVLIPVNYGRKFIDIKSDRSGPMIMVKARSNVSNQELMDELKGHMRSIRRLRPVEEDDFALNETKMLSAQVGQLFDVISIVGAIIGGFSILVGGFGIANIMFVSVRERTPIIGIQKSLGAKNYFILIQYLTESVILCLFGGLLGLILVYLATVIASGAGFDMSLSMKNALLGIGVSALIGMVSGLFPAAAASRLDPVEAIRANG
ncbi:MAG: ABC transporter permease [Bacteroidia bacterium]|nr:ABC transporter permease [Bacteroidia bacterium]